MAKRTLDNCNAAAEAGPSMPLRREAATLTVQDMDSEEDMGSGESEGEESEGMDSEDDNDDDDDDEDIRQAMADAQSRPKKKRKRALPSTAFGSLLSSLIAAPPVTKPLQPLHPPPSSEALERKAAKALLASRHEREERGHVADVIAGWTGRPKIPFSQWNKASSSNIDGIDTLSGGAEKEKELRRLAQKGTVRLFNAIKAAQATTLPDTATASTSSHPRLSALRDESASSTQRAIKQASPAASVASSAAPSISVASGNAHSRQANMLGSRGKQEALTNLSKASFLELFKTSGGAGKPRVAA